MSFKKTRISKSSHKTFAKFNYITHITCIIGVIFLSILGFLFVNTFDFSNIEIPTKQAEKNRDNGDVSIGITEQKTKKAENEIIEKKDRTNILIVGRGGEGHDAPNLTDTIILMSINSKHKKISMLSLPRDLYVEYNNGTQGRINAIYELEKVKNDSREIGMVAIADKVSELTQEKIDFFVNIDFNGFEKVIDVIGGIELTVEENLVDYAYPDGKGGYTTLVFRKGTWLFDGENTLKYARSRHSTSDFDRSLRQQQIINAVRQKLSTSYFIKSPTKIKELYDTFQKYIYTNIKFRDILKLAIQVKSGDYTMASYNINDSCFYGSNSCQKGGILYVPDRKYFGGASILLVDGTDKNNLSNYELLHKYTNIVFNFPSIGGENAKLNIYNSVRVNFLASILADQMKKFGFYLPEINAIGNTKKTYEKSVIYYNNIEETSQTIEILKSFFPNIPLSKVGAPKYSKELDTKIEIIIGQDYKEVMQDYLDPPIRPLIEEKIETKQESQTGSSIKTPPNLPLSGEESSGEEDIIRENQEGKTIKKQEDGEIVESFPPDKGGSEGGLIE